MRWVEVSRLGIPSDDRCLQLKAMKNKKMRRFYEDQNERLNDWLEVDTLVKTMSDEIVKSFDPQDADGDGVVEHHSALKMNGEDIETLLPEDERETRRIGKRNAKWAINVRMPA